MLTHGCQGKSKVGVGTTARPPIWFSSGARARLTRDQGSSRGSRRTWLTAWFAGLGTRVAWASVTREVLKAHRKVVWLTGKKKYWIRPRERRARKTIAGLKKEKRRPVVAGASISRQEWRAAQLRDPELGRIMALKVMQRAGAGHQFMRIVNGGADVLEVEKERRGVRWCRPAGSGACLVNSTARSRRGTAGARLPWLKCERRFIGAAWGAMLQDNWRSARCVSDMVAVR